MYLVDGLSEPDKIWHIDRGALLYIRAKIGELWPKGSLLGAKILKVKIFCNAFLLHRLAESDEIWRDEGHWSAAGYLPF